MDRSASLQSSSNHDSPNPASAETPKSPKMPGSSTSGMKPSPAEDLRRAQFVSGKDQYIYSGQNIQYLDCISSDVVLGHCSPKVSEAVVKQMNILTTNVGLLHDNTIALARKLVATLPPSLTACFLVNSGNEANDLALNIALCATGSDEIIALDRGDHGKSMACMKLSKDRSFLYGRNKNVHIIPCPDSYRGKYRDSDFPRDDIGWMYSSDVKDCCTRLAKEGKKIGTFISEILLHHAGHINLPSLFLQEVYGTIKKYGGLCIADETHTGLGRTGHSFWGFQAHGADVVPDIVTVGKGLGNGHPIAAVVTTKEIAKKFSAFGSYYSFLGDPVSCSAGLAVLSELEDGKLRENARAVGEYLLERFEVLAGQYPCIGDVRGVGLSIGIDIVQDRKSREPNPEIAQFIRKKMFERRILLEICGIQRNVIGLSPPLCISQEDTEMLVNEFNAVMEEALGGGSRKRKASESITEEAKKVKAEVGDSD